MQKSYLVVVFLLFTICNSLFANENYTKEEIQRMISKMVILGFNGENINQNDEIYKDIKSGLDEDIIFDKEPNNKKKVKNVRNKEQLKKLTSQLQSISKQKLLISIDQEGGIVQRLKDLSEVMGE